MALLVLPFLLWQIDRAGPEQTVDAEVIGIRGWRHSAANGRSHTHQAVTLQIEGLTRAELRRADDLGPGQIVPVRVRRGRLTGRAYFLGRNDIDVGANVEP